MKYCSHCGKELNDDAVFCTNCGCSVERLAPKYNGGDQSASGLSIAGLVLAILSPLIGLILCIIARSNALSVNDMKSYGYAKTGIIITVVPIGNFR